MLAWKNAFRLSENTLSRSLALRNFSRNTSYLGSHIIPLRRLYLADSWSSSLHSKWRRSTCVFSRLEMLQPFRKAKAFHNDATDLPSPEQLDQDRRTVFIGSLSSSTTDASLMEHFSKLGDVEETKIIRTLSGNSKGFAFVRFKERSALDEVIQREHLVDGRAVSVKKLDIFRSVHLENIPSSLGERQLMEYFSEFGKIERIVVPENLKTKEREGYCLITFESEVDAFELVKKGTHTLNGFEISVQFKMKLKHPRKVEIKNLPYNTTVGELKTCFSEYSGLKEIDLNVIPDRKQCQAFLTFTDHVSVSDIISKGDINFRGTVVKGEPVSKRYTAQARHKSLFIEDLPLTITKADLIKYFSQFGSVKNVSMVKTQANLGNMIQFGIVKFNHAGGLNKAMQQSLHSIDRKHYTVRQLGLRVLSQMHSPVTEDKEVEAGEPINDQLGHARLINTK